MRKVVTSIRHDSWLATRLVVEERKEQHDWQGRGGECT